MNVSIRPWFRSPQSAPRGTACLTPPTRGSIPQRTWYKHIALKLSCKIDNYITRQPDIPLPMLWYRKGIVKNLHMLEYCTIILGYHGTYSSTRVLEYGKYTYVPVWPDRLLEYEYE